MEVTDFWNSLGNSLFLTVATVVLLALIPILLFYIVCQKQILNGVVNGAVK
jgi:raffinose/stachyose/melibiose transport system permease protein